MTRGLSQWTRRYEALKAQLQRLGFICAGSLQSRRLECGQPACRCHRDPARRHGPYHYWTRKVRGKTVSIKLTADELRRYRVWVANNRTLDRLVRDMRRVSARVIALTTGRAAR